MPLNKIKAPITDDEVIKAVKRLKNGKACGEDYAGNDMIEAFSENNLHLLTHLSYYLVVIDPSIPNE